LSAGVVALVRLDVDASVGDPGHGKRRHEETMRHWITSFHVVATERNMAECRSRRKPIWEALLGGAPAVWPVWFSPTRLRSVCGLDADLRGVTRAIDRRRIRTIDNERADET
jgi:hypothetical protein